MHSPTSSHASRPKTWIGQSLRFGLIAPLVFLVDWSVLALLSGWGLPALAGRLVSLSATVCVGFLLNRHFTFRAKGRPHLAEFLKYVLAAAFGVVLNYVVFLLLHGAGFSAAIAIAGGMLAAAMVTFLRFRDIFRP